MHELGISEGILQAALSAPGATRENVRAFHIRVGALSSASPEALEFCMGLVLEQNGMAEAQVRIETAPARARCECGHEAEIENLFDGCPSCGGFNREILEGQDVTLQSIEVENGED